MPERIAALCTVLLLAVQAGAVEVPPEGSCPPYPVKPGLETTQGDVVPQHFELGERLSYGDLLRLQSYLPPEVWRRRTTFFYEGMEIKVGPCHRRYPAPEFFREATLANAGRSTLDAKGSLRGYAGWGLPFPPETIRDDDPRAGEKWAWNYRYRYQGSGFRGDFRIIHMIRRGSKVERFKGNFFMLALTGYPGTDRNGGDVRFWAGGRFASPPMARGLAWRQVRKDEVDWKSDRSDDVWVWLPDARRVRRAVQFAVEGIFMPSYTRGQQSSGGQMNLPDGSGGTPDVQIGATEHYRRGFVGLVIRPNAYHFTLLRAQDVLAPVNVDYFGYPADPGRSFGPSGLSVASGRWEIRCAVVLRGQRRRSSDNIASVTLYIDVLTQAPLYLISRKPNDLIKEVGIFVGKFTADDPVAPRWDGTGEDFGAILPVAQTFFVAGEGGWIRESFELRSDPPSEKERKDFTSVTPLQRRGR